MGQMQPQMPPQGPYRPGMPMPVQVPPSYSWVAPAPLPFYCPRVSACVRSAPSPRQQYALLRTCHRLSKCFLGETMSCCLQSRLDVYRAARARQTPCCPHAELYRYCVKARATLRLRSLSLKERFDIEPVPIRLVVLSGGPALA